MLRVTLIALVLAVASAFAPSARTAPLRGSVQMSAENTRRGFISTFAAVAAAAPLAALADVDYSGLPYLGGSDKIDLNNANVRVYAKFPGMYPNAAGKIVTNGPYKSVSDVYKIKGLTAGESAAIKKNEGKFIVLEPSAMYVIDRINNGLYR